MNKLRYMILAMTAMLSFAAISCNQEEEYTPGKPDSEDCFGVYFPSQDATSRTFTFEPGDRRRVKISVAREFSDVDYDITVPVQLTGDDVFEVEDIVFEGGATSTSFYVNFPDAEIGEKYTCTLEVNDPLFVSNYRTKANYITFTVSVVSWDEIGEATYIDNMFTNTQTGHPMTATVKVFRNSNDDNLYRVNDPYHDFMEQSNAASSTPAPEYFEFRVLQRGQEFVAYDGAAPVTLRYDDLIHYEPIFTSFAGDYGDAYYYHPCLLSGFEDPATWYDNRVLSWQDSQKKLPGVVQLAPSLYFPNAGGYPPAICITIVFPGAKLTDYSFSFVPGLSENGTVPVKVTLGSDVAKVKYAVFSGELTEKQVSEKSEGIASGKIASETVTETGDYNLENLGATGLYTLVAVAYNAAGEQVGKTAVTFGYLKQGDNRQVDINCGVIVSDKYAPEGYTSENSLEFYIYGSDIKTAYYGLYRKKDFEEKYESVMADLKSYEASEAELEAINSFGLSDIFIRLNSGMEYVLVVCASNGYEEKVIFAEAKLSGEINPLQMTYELDMLRPAETKADYCRQWEFWSGTPDTNGRFPVGPVTITDGGTGTVPVVNEDGSKGEMEVEYLSVKGFYKPVVDEGYITDDTMNWQYYEGAIVPLHGKIGEFRNTSGEPLSLEMISFFESGNGGHADGAVCGAFTEEGNIAFVDMETGNFDEEGGYWFTALGVFDSKRNYKGEMISYDEMMFLDPANVPADSTPKTSAVSMLKQVKANFQKNYNFVEYKHFQLYDAISSVFGKEQIHSFDAKAGLEIVPERAPVNSTLKPADRPAGILDLGKPGNVSLHK